MQQLRFGDITVDRIVEAEGLGFPPQFLLPESDSDAIRHCRDWLEPHFFDPESGRFIQSVHCYVVRSPRHTVLIDTCVGNGKDRPSTRAWNRLDTDFLDRLRGLGVAPDAVDYVLCTHLHVDHAGWNTRLLDGRWVPTFPNARYLFHETEFEHWERNGDYVLEGPGASDGFYEDSVLPVVEAKQAVFVADGHAIDDWLTVEAWPGHSPGHVCLRLKAGGREAVFAGDLLHHPVQCRHPDWNSRFCWDPALSASSRRRFVERHAETPAVILAAHFATPVAGRIAAPGGLTRFAML